MQGLLNFYPRRHVFRDLQPYICTFENCAKPDRLFGSRQDWYDHEFQDHRREWFCAICTQACPTPTALEEHVKISHADLPASFFFFGKSLLVFILWYMTRACIPIEPVVQQCESYSDGPDLPILWDRMSSFATEEPSGQAYARSSVVCTT